jgi:membrane protease YdiL (CAAX protease family)
MSADAVPPRPDGLHPVEPPPPTPTEQGGVEARPKATWSVWEALAVYLLAILIGGFATLPIVQLVDDEDVANLAASAVAALSIMAVLLAWLAASHRSWRHVMGFPDRGGWWAEVRGDLGFGLFLYPAMVFGVGLALSLVLSAISGQTAQAPEQVPPDLPAVGVGISIAYAIVIAPIHEEFFFRGVLFRSVRDRYGLWPGLLASGVGFSLIHYLTGPWQDTTLLMGVMLFNGMALAWWYERRGTIVAPMVAHMVFNVIGLSLILTLQ